MDPIQTRANVVSIREFSRRTGIPVTTVSRMVKRGQLSLVKSLVPVWGIPEEELTKYKSTP